MSKKRRSTRIWFKSNGVQFDSKNVVAITTCESVPGCLDVKMLGGGVVPVAEKDIAHLIEVCERACAAREFSMPHPSLLLAGLMSVGSVDEALALLPKDCWSEYVQRINVRADRGLLLVRRYVKSPAGENFSQFTPYAAYSGEDPDGFAAAIMIAWQDCRRD